MAQQRAVVVGAGMGGLLTARVLADRFEQVVVVDRDADAGSTLPRKGVPQGRHAHGLLPSGERVIRSLYPGLMEELVAGGAQPATTAGARWWQFGGYRKEAPAPDATFFSRPFLEGTVKAWTGRHPQVTFVNGRVSGLASDAGRVTGVVVEYDERQETWPADLVVDASGRTSNVGKWLAAMGYPEPPLAEIHIDMGYATRLYHRTPGRVPDGTFVITISDPAESKRIAAAFPIEGDRWIVTLCGMHGDHAPTDDGGFLAFAQTLPTDDVADIIVNEEPIGPIMVHRLASDQWRHFDKVKRHPRGFVAIGDSICSFNPIYGQGMSSAALQAVALGSCLDKLGAGSDRLPAAFYKASAKVIARPWAIAAGGDFSFAETTGPRPPLVDKLNAYVRKATIASQHDPVVATALWNVQALLSPPPALMRPDIFVRVQRAARKGATGKPFRAKVSS